MPVTPTVQRLLSIAGGCLALSVDFHPWRRDRRTSGCQREPTFGPLSEPPIWPLGWVACSPPWQQCEGDSRTGNGWSSAQETRRQLGQFTDVVHAVKPVLAVFDQSAEQLADLQLMFLAFVDGHSAGGLGQSADLANSRTTTEQQIQAFVIAFETFAIELYGLGLKCQAGLASHWTLAGGSWISGQTLRVRTKGAVALLADTMVSQLGEQIAQKTLDFVCPLHGGQYSAFGEVAGIRPYGAAASFTFHHLVGANVELELLLVLLLIIIIIIAIITGSSISIVNISS